VDHCPGALGLIPVENLPGLPFSQSLIRFRQHCKRCGPCSLARQEDPENCDAYCRYGHDLLHEVEADMDFTHAASHWN
jgi:hypothetical protein